MSISIGDNFSYNAAKPLDSRLLVNTVAEMKAKPESSLYDGLIAYCKENEKSYQWKSTNTVDEVLGKWREYSSTQVKSMPAAGVDQLGHVYQYLGETTTDFINGYFYKCSEDTSTTPSTYSWVNVEVQEGTISRELTNAEYEALSDAEKMDGTVYYVTDVLPFNPNSASTGFTPIGTIISVMGKTAPHNYLACDGAIYQISDYPELAGYFEQQFSAKNYFGGDGVETFAVPDLRGEFLRGTGTNSYENQGSGANVGEHQDATEISNPWLYSNRIFFPGKNETEIKANKFDSDFGTVAGRANFNSDQQDTDTTQKKFITTRPTNTSVLYCIAYRNIYITRIDAGKEYSTDEKEVGVWLDGSTIYQKTFTVPSLTTDLVVPHNISNFGKLIEAKVYGYWTEYDTWEIFGNDNPYYFVNSTNIELGSSYPMEDIHITIQYTKTA